MANRLFFNVAKIPQPLSLTGCNNLIEYFPLVFPGWEFIPAEADSNPAVSIEMQHGQYCLSTSWQEKIQCYTEEVEVLCALVAKLIKAKAMNTVDSLYLHAAAVDINGRLVVFPNKYHAGKSFMSACLAAAGFKLFCDDVLPVGLDDYSGIAPGLAPMLRLPLPANIDLASSAFIESHAILRGTRYLYLNLSDRNRHNLGARVPVGAFVLLERQDGAAPDIEVVSAAEILRQSIWQNFAREVDAPRILGGLSQIVSQARCMRLTYDRADEAIELLGERFGEWDQDSNQAVDPIPRLVPTVIPDSKSGDNRFVQAENVQVISVDKEKFLASPDGHAIHHLNPVASAIWGLLAAPNSIEDVASLLVAAFPETELKTIQKDVSSLMKTLISKNLVSLQK